jgi:hypothetical protein
MMKAMSHASITPSVQRLAEENNVDWRVLQGSGEGGAVTEYDVLEHLTRVMRGEEALDPTPEPLPEGLSAWPEEPERRRSGNDLFSAAFTATEPSTAEPPTEAHDPVEPPASPWLLDPSAVNSADKAQNSAAPEPKVEEPARPKFSRPAPSPWSINAQRSQQQEPLGEPEAQGEQEMPGHDPTLQVSSVQTEGGRTLPQEDTDLERLGETVPEAGVSEAVHQATLAELEALRARLAALEAERLRHVSELHQLSRMQETIALQKNEGAKLSAAQSEVQRLKTELVNLRGEMQRAVELEAKTRDLEARLTRARTFRKNAKAEYERLLADNMMLEHELVNLKKRRGFKLWGKS